MTSLPVPLVEAEALRFACGTIARFHSGGNPWSGDLPLSADGGRAFVRHLMRHWAHSAVGRMRLVELALAGEPDADDVIRSLIIEWKSLGLPLTTEFEYYNMIIVLQHGRPAQPPARKRKNHITRDICIALTVAALIDRYQLKATGRSPYCRSACAIVAEALHAGPGQLGYGAVEKIWKAHRWHMPTVPGWASVC